MRSVSVIRKPLGSSVGIGIVLHSAGGLDIDSVRIGDGSESKARAGEDSMSRRYTGRGGTDFAATPGVRGGGDTTFVDTTFVDTYGDHGSAARFFYAVTDVR